MPAVTVNLAVEVDANSGVTVFGHAVPTINNAIVAKVNLPASALNGLIEFWEPSTSVGDMYSHLDLELTGGINSYKTTAFGLYGGLKSVLAGKFDCKDATPFTSDVTDKTVRDSSYNDLDGFGKVALAQVAHAVFGHVAATAAITNDVAFVTAMAAETASANWAAIKDSTQSAAVPNLANALVKALVMKGYTKDASNNDVEFTGEDDASALTLIVKQVIGQDADRAKGQDNNQIGPSVHQKLVFAAGDIVYMTINVKYPTVTLSNSLTNLTPAYQSGVGSNQKFDLKITLS